MREENKKNPPFLTTSKERMRVYVHPWVRREGREAGRDGAEPLYECELPLLCYGKEDALAKRAVLSVYAVLPPEVRREVEGMLSSLGKLHWQMEELRLSRYALSSLTVSGREYAMPLRLSAEVLTAVVKAICHGAPFAHRGEMAEGYLPFEEGVRVGVVGALHYGAEMAQGALREVHTLVIRIPHTPPDASSVRELYKILRRESRLGCLIVSPPRVGKTTVLRMLCRTLAQGESAVRVAVVDTRCEFSAHDAQGTIMDILQGYPRHIGASIALRTLSPSVLGMDEIGGEEDAQALLNVMRSGIWMIATAHASSVEDIYNRPCLRHIVRTGVFDMALTLSRAEGGLRGRLCRL